ncbi:MAG: VOC family protein [Myxococcales bacterium]|nr:VOC family protein [Myxococcales bacterium]
MYAICRSFWNRTRPLWFELDTADVVRAKENYASLFGWDFRAPIDLGGLGIIHPFAWESGGPAIGAMRDLAAHPGVHAHWLYHLAVASVDAAVSAVRAGGGTVGTSLRLSDGTRLAVCDDPQGAAFAVRELPTATGPS